MLFFAASTRHVSRKVFASQFDSTGPWTCFSNGTRKCNSKLAGSTYLQHVYIYLVVFLNQFKSTGRQHSIQGIVEVEKGAFWNIKKIHIQWNVNHRNRLVQQCYPKVGGKTRNINDKHKYIYILQSYKIPGTSCDLNATYTLLLSSFCLISEASKSQPASSKTILWPSLPHRAQ